MRLFALTSFTFLLALAGCRADADPQRTTQPTPLTITASTVKWNLDDLSEAHTGKLKYLGGLELNSSNSNFGGLSGLHIDASGTQLLALSDQGHWLSAHIQVNDAGLPIGLDDAVLAPLLDEKGAILEAKANTDAEGLAVHKTGDGTREACVSFERKHRVLCYTYADTKTPQGPARKLKLPISFTSQLENNGSLETLLFMEGEEETLLTIAEQSNSNAHAALLFSGRASGDIIVEKSIAEQPPYAITDAARVPSTGNIILLERRFSPLAGVGLSLRRIAKAAWAEQSSKPIDGEILLNVGNRYSIDNMEGLSVVEKPDGSIWLHMISDDNFNPLQRSLLLTFELIP